MTFAFELDLNPRQDNFRGDYRKVNRRKRKIRKNRAKNSIQSLRAVFVGISQS